MKNTFVCAAFVLAGVVAHAGEGRSARCLLRVEHETYIDGPCTFSAETDGSFYIESPLSEYFVYVNILKPGVAQGWWNGHPAARRAHDALGLLYRDGACWVNDGHDQVCAW